MVICPARSVAAAGKPVRQHLLQSGRVSVVQCLAIRRDGGRRRCAAEVAVRRGRDSLQSVELRFDAVIFNLQSRDGICKARRLAGADLQTVLRQQESILGVGNAAVLSRVDLIQQVVQCLFCLVRQHRQIAAGGVLGLCQQRDGALEPVKPLALQSLGIIGVHFGHDGSVCDALTVLDKVAKVAAACHIHRVKRHNAVEGNALGQRVLDGSLCFVGAAKNNETLYNNIDRNQCQCQQPDHMKNFLCRCAVRLFFHCALPFLSVLQNSRTSEQARSMTFSSSI